MNGSRALDRVPYQIAAHVPDDSNAPRALIITGDVAPHSDAFASEVTLGVDLSRP